MTTKATIAKVKYHIGMSEERCSRTKTQVMLRLVALWCCALIISDLQAQPVDLPKYICVTKINCTKMHFFPPLSTHIWRLELSIYFVFVTFLRQRNAFE